MVASSKHFAGLTSWISPEEGLSSGLILYIFGKSMLSSPMLAFTGECSSYHFSGLFGTH